MHTIYHIDKKLQKKVVERLIEISKINKPIIIVYSNPNILLKKFIQSFSKLQRKNQTFIFIVIQTNGGCNLKEKPK